jgi:hypothetical protein
MRISSSRPVHLRSSKVYEQWGRGFESVDVSERTWTLGLPLYWWFGIGNDNWGAGDGGHDIWRRGEWRVGDIERMEGSLYTGGRSNILVKLFLLIFRIPGRASFDTSQVKGEREKNYWTDANFPSISGNSRIFVFCLVGQVRKTDSHDFH